MLALLLILGMFGVWIFNTQAGAGFVLARIQAALDGKLVVTRHRGTLAGPIELDEIRYRDPAGGIDATIQQARLDLTALSLLSGRVVIDEVSAHDVTIALASVPAKPDEPAGKFSLQPPLDILINKLALDRVRIEQDGKQLLVVDRLDLVGGWTSTGVAIKQLALRSPDVQIDLDGTLATSQGYAGTGQTTFTWRMGDTDLAGVLKSSSDGKQARLELNLTQPTAAEAIVLIGQSASMPWNLQLDVPPFPAKQVMPESSLGLLALSLRGTGDIASGKLDGTASIDAHQVILDPLQFTLGDGVVKIAQLHLTAPESRGALNLDGDIDTRSSPPATHLKARWDDIELPADLVGQPLASHGHLAIDGSLERFAAKGSLALGPADSLADIDIDIDGTPESIALNTLRLKQAHGGLDATGRISLQPTLGWQITATARKLDPGDFFADWPGAIDFVLDTSGTQTDNGPQGSLKLARVGGSLRDKPLSGQADLRMQPGYVVDGSLSLQSGGSRVSIEGQGGDTTDAQLRLQVASLADWLPDAGGRASGKFHVSGKWPQLDVDGDVSANEIAWSGIRAESLELVTKITNLDKPAGALTLKIDNLSRGDVNFSNLLLEGEGNPASHRFKLVATGDPASLHAAMDGTSKNGQWQGDLTKLELDPSGRNLPGLELASPAHLDWNGKRFELAESCLVGTPVKRKSAIADTKKTQDGEGEKEASDEQIAAESVTPNRPESPLQLCVAGNSATDGSLAAKYRLEHLPLRLLARLGAPDSPVRLRGEISGKGDINKRADAPLTGNLRIDSDKGDLFYTADNNKPLLSYQGFSIDAVLQDTGTTARVNATLDHDGLITGTLRMTPAEGGGQALDGNLKLKLNSLGFLELASSELSNTQGRLSADYGIAGTLAAPRLNGLLVLDGFSTEVPSAGLKLKEGHLTLRAADAQTYVVEGSIASGTGALTISGQGGIATDQPMKLNIKGEGFLAADIPAARVVLSPDLSIERNSDGIRVTGTVVVPSANVDLAKLPGGGASKASPDVVIVDAKQPEPGKDLPITALVTVSLGDKVKLAGFGFDGTLSGNLVVNERPGRATTGSGTLNAGGTYKAYGQDLKIETGRVLFAGTAIDNPGIDIRAVRKIQTSNVTAGLLVRGTAQIPVLTVFADPAMEQSEALSYLVTGKPLSALKSGEGDMLGTAARALGTAGGDLLAKSIGGKMGVDDIGVADNGTLGGAAFTIGKYLSPKLYLSYGVGVFEPGEVVTLRYLFSHRWNFEAQNATTGSRAGINYRFEK